MIVSVVKLEPGTNRVVSLRYTDPAIAADLMAKGWVQLTDEQDVAARRAGRSFALVNGAIVQVGALEPPLALVQVQACNTIDNAAELARQRFLTPGSGQALEYQATIEDAQAFVAAGGTGSASDHPWLAAEVSAGTVSTLSAAATAVLAQAAAWQTAGSLIKEIRRKAKTAVGAATTNAAIYAIVDSLRWPTASGTLDPDPTPVADPPPPTFLPPPAPAPAPAP